MEWPGQRVLDAADGDALLLHRLQQGGLGARAGTVDLIGHQQLAEHRAGHEAEAAPPFGLIQHLAADDVGRHEVGGELDALGRKAEDDAQGLDQPALAQARHADQQDMTARQQCDQGLIDYFLLAEDHPANGGSHLHDTNAQCFGRGQDGGGIIHAAAATGNRMWRGGHTA